MGLFEVSEDEIRRAVWFILFFSAAVVILCVFFLYINWRDGFDADLCLEGGGVPVKPEGGRIGCLASDDPKLHSNEGGLITNLTFPDTLR